MGILYNKGIIKDRSSIKESNDVISLRKKFKSEDSIERQKIIEKFENGELNNGYIWWQYIKQYWIESRFVYESWH